MKVTIELHDPEDMALFGKFLSKHRSLRARLRATTTGCVVPEPVTSPLSALDKLREQQSSHDQLDAYSDRELARTRDTWSQKSP